MAGKDIPDVTLDTVDPELLFCWKEKVKHGAYSSLLLKDRKLHY